MKCNTPDANEIIAMKRYTHLILEERTLISHYHDNGRRRTHREMVFLQVLVFIVAFCSAGWPSDPKPGGFNIEVQHRC